MQLEHRLSQVDRLFTNILINSFCTSKYVAKIQAILVQNYFYLGVPYLPCSLVWTKKVWTNILLSTLPTYPKSLDILELKFALEFLILTGI